MRHGAFLSLGSAVAIWACSMDGQPTVGDRDGAGGHSTSGVSEPVEVTGGEVSDLESKFSSPVVSGRFLWTANPATNRVGLIDSADQRVRVLDGGNGPTFLQALPVASGIFGALVLNVGGGDATLFSLDRTSDGLGGAASVEGDVRAQRFDVQPGASRWAIGPRGELAIAWSDSQDGALGSLDGYQELTVVDLDFEGSVRSEQISAGFRPSQVVLSADESRAYVVSEPGISVIDFSEWPPRVMREIPLPPSPSSSARDVSFTPDGELAFIRQAPKSELLVVRTSDDTRVTIPLPRAATDVDLSADGGLAVVVMRGEPKNGTSEQLGGAGGAEGQPEQSEIALLPVPEIFQDPSNYRVVSTNELVGSVVLSADASLGLLYTNAIDNSRLTLLNLESLEQRTIDVTAPIRAAFVSADARYAVTVMTPPAGSQRIGAFALLDLTGESSPRVQGTFSATRFVAFEKDRVLVTTWGSAQVPAASYLGRFPKLSVDRIPLSQAPLASGVILESRRAFVAQDHPEGSVVFVDVDTAATSTVTGFELTSEVVE